MPDAYYLMPLLTKNKAKADIAVCALLLRIEKKHPFLLFVSRGISYNHALLTLCLTKTLFFFVFKTFCLFTHA